MRIKYLLLYCTAAFLFLSCHDKKENTILEQFFEDNVLDQTFVITYANDQGSEITQRYTGYSFVLKKGSDFYHGPLHVFTSGLSYTGSWSCNDDYSKLKIALPSPPVEFQFLTRDWRFTSKSLPELKFAPWGGSDEIKLTMTRK